MESKSTVKNANSWFEIAVHDLERATRFYETTLGVSLRRETFYGTEMTLFPKAGAGAGGALIKTDRWQPGGGGSVVYLNTDGQLDACLARVARAGGLVVTPKTDIGEAGAYAVVRDTENNLVGLHSDR